MSSSAPTTLRMLALIQLVEMRQAQTKALASDLANAISSEKNAGKSPVEVCEALCGDSQAGNELRFILSEFYTRESELLVKLGICEVVPVGSAEEAQAEAAEILTRAKGH